MSHCKKIRRHLPAFLAAGLPPEIQRQVQEHLAVCPGCRRELQLLTVLERQGQRLSHAAERAEQGIDWLNVPAQILQRLDEREGVRAPRRRAKLAWMLKPAAAMAGLLLVAVAVWLIRPWGARPASSGPAADTIAHWETSISRHQLVSYLNDSQMVLTDMLKQCRSTPPDPQEREMQTRLIRSLLQKHKYLQPDLEHLELAKAQPLCQKLDYLFYEIIQVPPANSCSDIERIQGLIRRDNLLLKIRLLEKDLTFTGQKEV